MSRSPDEVHAVARKGLMAFTSTVGGGGGPVGGALLGKLGDTWRSKASAKLKNRAGVSMDQGRVRPALGPHVAANALWLRMGCGCVRDVAAYGTWLRMGRGCVRDVAAFGMWLRSGCGCVWGVAMGCGCVWDVAA